MSTTLAGLALVLPVRHKEYACLTEAGGELTSPSLMYVSDWLQGHPGVALLLGVIFWVGVLLPLLMLATAGPLRGQFQVYLWLQGSVAGLATLFFLSKFGLPNGSDGYSAVILLGTWGCLGSCLWVSGRLDRWMLPQQSANHGS